MYNMNLIPISEAELRALIKAARHFAKVTIYCSAMYEELAARLEANLDKKLEVQNKKNLN